MARPSKFNREEAISIAMHEFWRSGYETNSVKAISEKLGITRSSYYNAFVTREGLFKLALAAYFDQSPDKILYGELPDMEIRELLTFTFFEICRVRAEDPESRGCLAINSLTELGNTHDEIGPLLINSILGSVERIEELLDIAAVNGELPKDADTHGLALALQTLMIGINAFSKALKEESELRLTVKTTLMALGLYKDIET